MGAAGVAILVLVGAMILEALVLGIWIWARGKHVDELELAACLLGQEIDRLKRERDNADERSRVEDLSDADLLHEFNRPPPIGAGTS